MSNRSIAPLGLLALAIVSAGTLSAQQHDRRVYPDSQPFRHYAWVIDTAALEGSPAKVLRRPGKRPQDVILVSRAATAEDLLLATQTLDLLRAARGDTVWQPVEMTPRGRLNRDSPTVARRLVALEGDLAMLRMASPQYTDDFGEVRLMAIELRPPGRVKSKAPPKAKP